MSTDIRTHNTLFSVHIQFAGTGSLQLQHTAVWGTYVQEVAHKHRPTLTHSNEPPRWHNDESLWTWWNDITAHSSCTRLSACRTQTQRQTHGTQTASEQLLPQEKPGFNHSIAQRFPQCHYEQVGDFWPPWQLCWCTHAETCCHYTIQKKVQREHV